MYLSSLMVLAACQNPNPPEDHLSLDVPPPSRVDYALSFDGVNDYATMGTARFPLPTGSQTISLWVSPNATRAVADLIVLRRDDSGNEFELSAAGAPIMNMIWASVTLVEAESIGVGSWHHLAYVYDSPKHMIYVDGELKATGTATPNNRSPTSGWVGSMDGTRNFYGGLMDDIRIWSQARTQDELRAEMANGTPTTDPDLVGYYTFDEDNGPLVYDRSGNGNHLALGDGVSEYAPSRVTSTRP